MTEIKVAAGALAVSALFLAGVTLRPEARVARLPVPASITLGHTGTLWSDRPAVAKAAAAKVVEAIPASAAPVAEVSDQPLMVLRIPRAVRSGTKVSFGPDRGQRQQASTTGRGSSVAPGVIGVSGVVTSGLRAPHPAVTSESVPAPSATGAASTQSTGSDVPTTAALAPSAPSPPVAASSPATIAPAPVVLATPGPTGKVQEASAAADEDDEEEDDDGEDDEDGGNSGPGGGGSSGSNSGPGGGSSGDGSGESGSGGSGSGGGGSGGSGGGGSGGGGSGGSGGGGSGGGGSGGSGGG